jgi:hypothetical protein
LLLSAWGDVRIACAHNHSAHNATHIFQIGLLTWSLFSMARRSEPENPLGKPNRDLPARNALAIGYL